MFEYWLSLWSESNLPTLEQFSGDAVQHLLPNTLIFDFAPDESVSVRFSGESFSDPNGGLAGADWLSAAPPKSRRDRLDRFNASARGAIVRGIPEAILKSEHAHFYEAIHFPFQSQQNGSTPILVYVDWDPPSNENMPLPQTEAANLPILTQIFPLARNGIPAPDVAVNAPPVDSERAKIMSRAAMRLLLNLAADFMADTSVSELDPLDYYIAIAVGNANVAHIDSDPILSRQYAGLVEPDYMRRGISRAAISRATRLPLETVRRRINKMIALNLLLERKDGIVVSASNRLKLGSRVDRMHVHAQLIERMFRDLKARGIRFE